MIKKGLPVKEGLLNFYAATHITLQTFPQECFLVRLVYFNAVITGACLYGSQAKVAVHYFITKISNIFL
jgi:hypothetical protein